ncbi:DUF3572 domain-containing protein [Rhizobium oryziradicis]|uniref:DUF3572 domain-containing protein n=1 Tax=Rhizobium oryziradicis TaxID=1867956 RepID=A0A1Q8ZMW7_9HYPH|nr:DUF3572 domain-containing protein [Rhizobium oryziradicis]OLP43250.1 hypothetical protein BJF95_20315 [Rhizobium oryziradicis]
MRDKLSGKSTSSEHAEQTAIAVLSWLAGEPEMLGRFLSLTGVEPGQMRQAIKNPDFLAGMLDFIVQHEPTLLDFCAATQSQPEDVMAAWRHYTKPGLDSGEY